MDDRDLDRHLSQRLRAYESRLPETDAPDPRGIRQRNGVRWPAIAGVLGAAVIVGVLAGVVLLLNRPSVPVGDLPPLASPSSAGVEELALDTPRRECPGSPDQLLAIYRIPNGEAFWTVFPQAGRAPELAAVQVPLLVVVYDGRYSGSTFGGVGSPLPSAPAPGTADVCIESADGSEAIASSSYAVYLDIPLPSQLAVASPDPTSSAEPTAEPEPTASPAPELEWSQTASFGSPNGMTIASDVIEGSMGIVAVGTEYFSRLPNLGPTPPHAGRVWLSADGQQWQDVTPVDIFGNTSLHDVILTSDGSLIAFGTVSAAADYGLTPSGEAAWSSVDGRIWTPVETGLPTPPMALSISQGGHGYLAHLVEFGATHGSELWFSEDGRSWEHVRTLRDGQKSLGAGAEGFVVVGVDGLYGDVNPFAIASGDGREWLDSPQPPDDAWLVTPRGGDWLAIAAGFAGSPVSTEARTWSSPDGLDWVETPGIPLAAASADSSLLCPEYVRAAYSAEPWTIVGTQLGGGCGEGGFYVNGTQLISTDGSTWLPLPFEIGSPGDQASGAFVHGAVVIDGRVALIGEANRQAGFWLGTPD
jgi:hypothetical protein